MTRLSAVTWTCTLPPTDAASCWTIAAGAVRLLLVHPGARLALALYLFVLHGLLLPAWALAYAGT